MGDEATVDSDSDVPSTLSSAESVDVSEVFLALGDTCEVTLSFQHNQVRRALQNVLVELVCPSVITRDRPEGVRFDVLSFGMDLGAVALPPWPPEWDKARGECVATFGTVLISWEIALSYKEFRNASIWSLESRCSGVVRIMDQVGPPE